MKKQNTRSFKLLAVLFACVLFIQMPAAYAASLSDLKKERSELEAQKKALNNSLQQKASELKSNQNKQQQIITQLEQIGTKIDQTNQEIAVVKLDIEIANQEIAALEQSIAELQEKIDQRDALLRERARAIQTGGTVSYIDVLLGANSFVDFIDRFSAVSTLMDADRQIMREQKEDQEKLEIQKADLLVKKADLEANKAQLEKLRANLEEQKKEKNKLVDELEKEEARLHEQKESIETHLEENIELSKELESEIMAEQRRQAEIARKKALEAAAKKKQENNASSSGNLPTVSAGTWTRPAAGRYTSGFGGRDIGPIGSKYHLGVDIANSIGTPVVAAADGVVSYVGTMSGYGKVVMVTHSLDGKPFTSVYGHLSGFTSSVGDVVSKGDQIAKMGNTGNSTGPHVHFEIHVGEWNGKRSNAVNPLRYISL
ncbi:peptidoglycan DD-metalloendopeptidase family protein [Solibacillus sp. MA9]|uniref:Peptidoglycan DD-metalloendopeptidase family protein n=1 Tax=Solibacillus palustris TaxID=2908203 RepID=A0ABS9U8J6_9BACL|nr:M23 family metallopeptidase [Solibacillus sp. MA9]MCH7320675.1 peptidoglycan DD-metalloendopeptidase family protein [Solibacillus sp. MA9]